MLIRMSHRRIRHKAEGEKPFWISYADLMSGMMILFLITMATVMVIITRKVAQGEAKEVIRNRQIAQICHQLRNTLTGDDVIGHFAFDSYRLPKAVKPALARLIPVVLKASRHAPGAQMAQAGRDRGIHRHPWGLSV